MFSQHKHKAKCHADNRNDLNDKLKLLFFYGIDEFPASSQLVLLLIIEGDLEFADLALELELLSHRVVFMLGVFR
jgi:hypothetical protein